MINAFSMQKRVIAALILREIHTHYGDRKFGYLWVIIEYIMHIVFLGLMFTLLGRSAPIGGNLIVFFATGLIPFLLFRHINGEVINAVNGNQPLLSYPMVFPIDLMVARTILECATTGVVVAVFLAVGFYFNLLKSVDSILDILLAFLAIVPISIGFGMIVALLQFYVPLYKTIHRYLMRPLYFISGIFFLADSLPLQAQQALFFNPLLHIVEWVRSDFFVEYESHFVDKLYVVKVGVMMLFFGLLAERFTKNRVRQEGD